MSVTLKDVAKRAGVSVPTVSLIINGRDMPFKESTRRAVLEAVEALNYRPDSMARRTVNKSNRRDAVAMLLRSESKSRVANSPAYEFICGVNDVLMEQRQFLVIMKLRQLEGLDNANAPPRVIAEKFIDGLIVETGLPEKLEAAVLRYDIPTVWLNTNHHYPTDCVSPDEIYAGQLVTEHLISLGHRRIIFCGPVPPDQQLQTFSWQARQKGYEEAMKSARLSAFVLREGRVPDPLFDAAAGTLGTTSADLSPVAKAVFESRQTSDPITGVVAYDLVQAVRLRQLLQDAAVLCPRDVSIIAAEDLRFVRRMWPEFTGITCDRYKMGETAANMMLAKIGGGGAPQASVVFKGNLIRGTTAAPLSDSAAVRKISREKPKPQRQTAGRARA